jgi:hypothetical protein
MLGATDPRASCRDCHRVLHRVVQRRPGLRRLLALARRSSWRASSTSTCGARISGLDEQFDADRFGVWIETLAESGADAAAGIVARMDVDR